MASDKRTVGGVIRASIGFLVMSVVAGLLVTATVTPAVAIAGVAANQTIGLFDGLPEYLEVDKLSQKSNIYATRSDGSTQLLASFYVENRVEVPFDQMSQFVKDAAVAGEDPRFFDHGGIDIPGTLRAVAQTYVLRGDLQGGSSITQQYVKNVLVEKAVQNAASDEERDAAVDDATRTTPERKLREMKLAIGIEKEYSKEQILQGYLNIAFFGGTVYGIESAANYYYGTTAAALSLPQAASLLAIVNSPDALRIDQPTNEVNGAADGYAENKERRDYILGKMLEEGKIAQADHDAAVATPVTPAITEPSTGCSTAGTAGFFCDYVTYILKNDDTFGDSVEERWLKFRRGGLDVYTTLDLDLQSAAVSALDANVPKTWSYDLGGSVVSVEVGTGRVLAMTQNKNYSQDPDVLAADPTYSALNLNTDYAFGNSGGIQPGSTYKLFTLIEWLKKGHSINETVNGTSTPTWGTFKDRCSGGTTTSNQKGTRNDDGGNGEVGTPVRFTQTSLNTGFVAMARQLDLCDIRDTAFAMGVHRADDTELQHNPSSILGTNEIAPLSMAGAYATVASGGVTCDPVAIDRIVDATGAEQSIPGSDCRQSIERNVAATAAVALRATFRAGGTATASDPGDGVPLIGKTGTTDSAKSTWMSGASTRVATVVGVYNIVGSYNLRQSTLPSGPAATARHRIWPRVMAVADAKYGGAAFPEADGSLQTVPQAKVPDVSGLSYSEAEAKLEAAGFSATNGGAEANSAPAGSVIRTSPSGTAARGSLITVYTSAGAPAPATQPPAAPSAPEPAPGANQRTVPDLGGQDYLTARDAAANAGFSNPSVQCTQNDDAPVFGTVTSQSPGAGASVPDGTGLSFTVAAKVCP